MNFVTFEMLNDCIYKNLKKVPRDIDLIVGIPRSGMLAANILALYLNIPFTDIDNFLAQGNLRTGNTRKCANWIKSVSEAKKVLVVDDSISAGDAMKEAKKEIRAQISDVEVLYLAVYALPTNISVPDIYFEICNHPRMFEWNYMHHWGLEYTCMDIDGVVCEDPSYLQSNNEEKYIEFLKNAEPRFLPTKKVGYFVTSRLEKYRELTEEWLEKNNIEYGELIMPDLRSNQERLKVFNHAKYKASVYKKTNCFLFIESSYEQAVEICRLSGKQVFCVDKKVLITPDNVMAHVGIINRDFKITAKRVVKKLIEKSKRNRSKDNK